MEYDRLNEFIINGTSYWQSINWEAGVVKMTHGPCNMEILVGNGDHFLSSLIKSAETHLKQCKE